MCPLTGSEGCAGPRWRAWCVPPPPTPPPHTQAEPDSGQREPQTSARGEPGPHEASQAFLGPGALRVRVFSLSPTAPGQRSPTSCPRKQARGGCVAGRGVVGLVLVGT